MLTYSRSIESFVSPNKAMSIERTQIQRQTSRHPEKWPIERHIRASYVNTKGFALLINIRLTDSFIREVVFAIYTYMLLR